MLSVLIGELSLVWTEAGFILFTTLIKRLDFKENKS